MGTPRIRSKHSKVFVQDMSGADILVGEIDSLTEKDLSDVTKSQAMGQLDITANVEFGGWELSFEGGKVDADLAALVHAQDKQIAAGGRSPYFKVVQQKKFWNGTIEEYVYPEVTIYGYDCTTPNQDALTEKFTGFCGKPRVKGQNATNTSRDSVIQQILTTMQGTPEWRGGAD